nr:hypothetical protein [Tanacetum cinerariifolium]
MYGLHQAPKAWYGTLSKYLLTNGFQRGTIDQTLFIRKHRGDFLFVQVYVDDIIFGSSNPQLCREFEALMHEKFQMSAMDVRSANTPMDKENPWGKDGTGKDVDLHLYRSIIGSLMYDSFICHCKIVPTARAILPLLVKKCSHCRVDELPLLKSLHCWPEKIKDRLGYNDVPPPAADLYLSPKKDLSWTGLPEFADNTVTDYSRPAPPVESTSEDGQNRISSASKNGEPTDSILSKHAVKFVKAVDRQAERPTTNQAKTLKKPTVKYAEMYRRPSKKPTVRGNQQN